MRRQESIVSEWDLICGHAWKAQATNSGFFLGFLIGAALFGFLADRCGAAKSRLSGQQSDLGVGPDHEQGQTPRHACLLAVDCCRPCSVPSKEASAKLPVATGGYAVLHEAPPADLKAD